MDWSISDRDILSLVIVGIKVNSCILCNQVDHSTQCCPLQASTQQGMAISTHMAVTKQADYVHVAHGCSCTGARQPSHTPGPKTTQTAKPTTSKNPENKHNSK